MESIPAPSSLLAIADGVVRDVRGTSLGEPEIGELLSQLVVTAREAWPELEVPIFGFVEHLARRLPEDVPPIESLLVVRAADLYLAFACALRDDRALAEFEATLGPEFRLVHSRVRDPKPDLDDFRQECRKKLFLASPPKIGDYSGQGDLRSWLRVTLLRTLIDLTRKASHREQPIDDERVLEIPAPSSDPELEHLKTLYRQEFKQAFSESAEELSPEDRNLLRAHFGHGLTIDQLAALHHVHRATAARRIARARDGLLSGTRRRLMLRLRLGRSELDSVMRMIESNVQISLQRVLGSEGGT